MVIFQGMLQFPHGFLKSNSKHHLSVQAQFLTVFLQNCLVDTGFLKKEASEQIRTTPSLSSKKYQQKRNNQQTSTNTQMPTSPPSTATFTKHLASRAKAKESAVAKSALAAATAKMRQFLQLAPTRWTPTIVLNGVITYSP